MSIQKIHEFFVPFILILVFFLVESFGFMSELSVTGLLIAISIITFASWSNHNEYKLFFVGLFLGTFFEVGFRLFGNQQYWTNASFFGVPYWLPICWGLLFVLITRLGALLRSLK